MSYILEALQRADAERRAGAPSVPGRSGARAGGQRLDDALGATSPGHDAGAPSGSTADRPHRPPAARRGYLAFGALALAGVLAMLAGWWWAPAQRPSQADRAADPIAIAPPVMGGASSDTGEVPGPGSDALPTEAVGPGLQAAPAEALGPLPALPAAPVIRTERPASPAAAAVAKARPSPAARPARPANAAPSRPAAQARSAQPPPKAPARAAAPSPAPPTGRPVPPPGITPVLPAQAGTAERWPTVADLPGDVRSRLPRIALAGGMYSSSPEQRLVVVGGQVAREGDTPLPGVKLLQIRPRSAVFEFEGQRFEVPQ